MRYEALSLYLPDTHPREFGASQMISMIYAVKEGVKAGRNILSLDFFLFYDYSPYSPSYRLERVFHTFLLYLLRLPSIVESHSSISIT